MAESVESVELAERVETGSLEVAADRRKAVVVRQAALAGRPIGRSWIANLERLPEPHTQHKTAIDHH